MMAHCLTVPWSAIDGWDLKAARAIAFRRTHPTYVPLGAYAEESTELAYPSREPTREWPVYGVSNDAGVFFSHLQRGRDFRSPYKRIKKDWFFHNPTRANVGSLGRVPDVPDGALTSPEYQVWKIRNGLLPDYVELLLKTAYFRDLIQFHRVGAVKERLFVQNLLEIPIPPFDEATQRQIIDHVRAAESAASQLHEAAARLQLEADAAVLELLGYELRPEADARRFLVMHWQRIDRWGVSYNQQGRRGLDLDAGKYPVVELRTLEPRFQYGTSRKANTEGTGTRIIRMNNIVDGALVLDDVKHVELPEAERQALLLRSDDILINRTNSKELVGKCAVFREQGEWVFASYIIRVQVSDKLDPYFAAIVINSPIGRQQIDAMSRQIIGQANINTEEIGSLRLPLPRHDIQERCVRAVRTAEAEVRRLNDTAHARRANAFADFDRALRQGRLP